MMLRSTWNVWTSVGLLSRCLDYDHALVTNNESRVGSTGVLDKGISVFGDFDYSGFVGCGCQRFAPCKGSGIGTSGVRVRRSRAHHSEFANEESSRQPGNRCVVCSRWFDATRYGEVRACSTSTDSLQPPAGDVRFFQMESQVSQQRAPIPPYYSETILYIIFWQRVSCCHYPQGFSGGRLMIPWGTLADRRYSMSVPGRIEATWHCQAYQALDRKGVS